MGDIFLYLPRIFYHYYFIFFYGQNYELIYDILLSLCFIFIILLALYIIIFLRYYKVYFINVLAVTGALDNWFLELDTFINIYNKQFSVDSPRRINSSFARKFMLQSALGFFTLLEYTALLVIVLITFYFIFFKPTFEISGLWRFKLWLKPMFFFTRPDFLFKNDEEHLGIQNYPMIVNMPYPELEMDKFVKNTITRMPFLSRSDMSLGYNLQKLFESIRPGFFNKAKFRKVINNSLKDKSIENMVEHQTWLMYFRSNSLKYFHWFRKTDSNMLNPLNRIFKNVSGAGYSVMTFRPDSDESGLWWANPNINMYPSTFFSASRYKVFNPRTKRATSEPRRQVLSKSTRLTNEAVKLKFYKQPGAIEELFYEAPPTVLTSGRKKTRKRGIDFRFRFFSVSRGNLAGGNMRASEHRRSARRTYEKLLQTRKERLYAARDRLRDSIIKEVEDRFKTIDTRTKFEKLIDFINEYNGGDTSVAEDFDFLNKFNEMLKEKEKTTSEAIEDAKTAALQKVGESEFASIYRIKLDTFLDKIKAKVDKESEIMSTQGLGIQNFEDIVNTTYMGKRSRKVRRRPHSRFSGKLKRRERMYPLTRTTGFARFRIHKNNKRTKYHVGSWLWETWSTRSIYDIIRQKFFTHFRHGLGEYRLYKRRLVNYFTGRVYNPETAMFKEFPHYKRRFMLRDWFASKQSFRRPLPDFSELDNRAAKFTKMSEGRYTTYQDISGTLRGDDLLEFNKDDPEEEEPLMDLLWMFRETLREKNLEINKKYWFTRNEPSTVEEFNDIWDELNPPVREEIPPPMSDDIWHTGISSRGYNVLNHRLLRRISDPARYLDPRSPKRAKAIYMFTRSMNQSHYDHTRNTHRWWSMQGFKWPFARFMNEYPYIRESPVNKRVGLVSRYNKFYFSREPFSLSGRRLLAHDTSDLAALTRAFLFQFMEPTWFSYLNGDDIVTSYPRRASMREEYNKMKYSTKLRWFTTRLAFRQLFHYPNIVDEPFLFFLQDEVDQLIKDMYASIYYLPAENGGYINLSPDLLTRFGLSLWQLKKLGAAWEDSLNRYINAQKEDKGRDNRSVLFADKNLFGKGLDNNDLIEDFGNIVSNKLINYCSESTYSKEAWMSFLLDSGFNPPSIYDFESLKFSENCKNNLRANENFSNLDSDEFWFNWFNSLSSFPSSDKNVRSNVSGETLLDSSNFELYEFEKLQRESPNSLAFLGLDPKPYSNRLSSHVDPFMSDFAFDSYKSREPVTYLNNLLYSRWHRHRILPTELAANGRVISRKDKGFPYPVFFHRRLNFKDLVTEEFSHELEDEADRVTLQEMMEEEKSKKKFSHKSAFYYNFFPILRYFNFSYKDKRYADFSNIGLNDDFNEKKFQLNSYILRPYDIPVARVPDIEVSLASNIYLTNKHVLDLFDNYSYTLEGDSVECSNSYNAANEGLPFDLSDEIKAEYGLNNSDIWPYEFDFSNVESDKIWNMLRTHYLVPLHEDLSRGEIECFLSDRKYNICGAKKLYIIPTRFRSLVSALQDYDKSLYPDFAKSLDLYGKVLKFSPELYERTPSRGAILVEELSDPFYVPYNDMLRKDILNYYYNSQGIFGDSYGPYEENLDRYLEAEDAFRDFNFYPLLEIAPSFKLGKYNQGSNKINIDDIFLRIRYQGRRPKKGKKSNFDKNKLNQRDNNKKDLKKAPNRQDWLSSVKIRDRLLETYGDKKKEPIKVQPREPVVLDPKPLIEENESTEIIKKFFEFDEMKNNSPPFPYPLPNKNTRPAAKKVEKKSDKPKDRVESELNLLRTVFKIKLHPHKAPYKIIDEVSYINLFYAFKHVIRKLFRFFILNFIEFIPNFDYFLNLCISVKKLSKLWINNWLNIFSLCFALSFFIIWGFYRSAGGLIPLRYKQYSGYLIRFRPRVYFARTRQFLKKWIFRSFTMKFDNQMSNHLPFVGTNQNARFSQIYYNKFVRINDILTQLDTRPHKEYFKILFPQIVETWEHGLISLKTKIKEARILYKKKTQGKK